MIHDLDDTLKKLLTDKVPIDITRVDIDFGMPNEDYSKKLSRPTINLFLYGMRENVELRTADRFVSRDLDSGRGSLRRGPVRMDLTYLISAWTTEPADEHQLLGQIMATLVRFPTLPDDVLQGSMRNQSRPLQAWFARPEHTSNPWDVWGHVHHRMKAALSYVITVAVETEAAETAEVPKTAPLVKLPPVVNVSEIKPKVAEIAS